MKIKILPEAFASEAVIQEAIDAAASQMPAGKAPPSADVIRDAAGKVVSANVNLPDDISPADLTKARDKINEHNDVSRAGAFPVSITEDFEGAVDGAFFVHPQLVFWNSFKGNTTAPLAGSVDLKAAAGSSQRITLEATTMALSKFSAVEVSGKLKGFSIGAMNRLGLELVGNCYFFETNGNIWVRSPSGVNTDTGIAYVAGTVYTISAFTSTSYYSMSIDGVAVASGVVSSSPVSKLAFMRSTSPGMQLDDLVVNIFDGEV